MDQYSAPALNVGDDIIEDILILHTENGRDHFISISGTWKPSIFGCNLISLLHINGQGIRNIGVKRLRDIHFGTFDTSEMVNVQPTNLDLVDWQEVGGKQSGRLSIPHELWRIVDFIFRYGMDLQDLWSGSSGSHEWVEYIQDCLETVTPFDLEKMLKDPEEEAIFEEDNSMHTSEINSEILQSPQARGREVSVRSMVDVLKRFLGSLAEPVVPFSSLASCLNEGCNNLTVAQECVQSFPPVHRNVFLYIISFLKETGGGEKIGRYFEQIFF